MVAMHHVRMYIYECMDKLKSCDNINIHVYLYCPKELQLLLVNPTVLHQETNKTLHQSLCTMVATHHVRMYIYERCEHFLDCTNSVNINSHGQNDHFILVMKFEIVGV